MSAPDELFELVDKPAGVPGSDHDQTGYAQFLSRRRGYPLFTVNDLDRDISGAQVLARSAQTRDELRQQATRGRMRLLYRFISDRRDPAPALPQPTDASESVPGPLLRCDLALFRGTGYSVWETEARGLDRAAELRARAARAGIPVLGDTACGGSPFPRVMLHCLEVSLESSEGHGDTGLSHRVPPPFVFDCPDQFGQADLIGWLVCIERRQRTFSIESDTAVRLIHTDGRQLRCDRLGPVGWFYWYGDEPPTPGDQAHVATLAAVAGASHWRLQWMSDRGRDPQHKQLWGDGCGGVGEWVGSENGVRYLFREGQGLSPGLFLDQRLNRLWVKEHVRGLRVLNLFSYTGGFGLCAAAGGAAEIVNVDSSRSTQEWARQNFLLNGFDLDRVAFPATDARLFVKGCARRGRQFDLIVCDPPSFARCSDGVFQLERHLPPLVRDMVSILAPQGSLVVSTNYEKWNARTLRRLVADNAGERSRLLPMPEQDWDFELPGEGREPILKSVRLQT